eukprot:3726581-Rhodomonas_salina.3
MAKAPLWLVEGSAFQRDGGQECWGHNPQAINDTGTAVHWDTGTVDTGRKVQERHRETQRDTERQVDTRHRGTEGQRGRGTEGQRHRFGGTEAQRHRGQRKGSTVTARCNKAMLDIGTRRSLHDTLTQTTQATERGRRRATHERTAGKAALPLVALGRRQVVEPNLDSAPLRIGTDRIQGSRAPRRYTDGRVQHSASGAAAQTRSKLTDVALGQTVRVCAG